MARVTVEDCIEVVPNRFDLVILTGQRAKQIAGGAPLTVDRDRDKDAVVALREVAERTVDTEQLREDIIQSNCLRQAPEEFEAIPFADEIEDELQREVAEDLAEEGAPLAAESDEEVAEAGAETEAEAPENLSFADENIDIED